MNKITITVSGHVGTGKTTLANLIANTLREHGIAHTVRDDTGFPTENWKVRIPTIAEKTAVFIVTEQQNRHSMNTQNS